MSYHFSYYVLPLIASALLSTWVMTYAWRYHSLPSAVFLGNMAFAITVWSLGYALEIAGSDLPTKIFWGKLQYIGIVIVPLSWVVFAYLHVHPGELPQPRKMLILSVVPTVTIVLAFTTEIHGLIWKTIAIEQSGEFSALAVTHGLWFWINIAYTYMLLLAGTLMLARSLLRMQGLYRGQMAALITALAAPWIGNALYLSGLSPIPHLDPTPFGFAISAAGGAWAIFGYQLVKLSPIARDLIVESMLEGMIVVDGKGHIADINPAAGRMIGIPGMQAMGKSLGEAFAPWPHFVNRFGGFLEGQDQIAVGEGEARSIYDVRIAALRDRQNNLLGRMITLRITNQDVAPAPRKTYTYQEAPTQPLRKVVHAEAIASPSAERKRLASITGWLLDFILTPAKTDLPVPPDINPKWHQARERSFTVILRVAAVIGSITLLFAPSLDFLEVRLPFAIIIGLLWVLGLVRQYNYHYRVIVFLVLIFALAAIETYSFGYSGESLAFFIAVVVSATLLLGRSGGLAAFFAAVTTLSVLGIFIGAGLYLPIYAIGGIPIPHTIQNAITTMLAFSATAVAMITAVSILMESLNKAWQMETQSRNLLQQERDLLDRRVTERTHDLAEAHGQAVRTSNELRKYFLAIEQSGSTIVITDTKGNIEYVNPKFTEMTGYAFAEAIGQNPRVLKSGEHAADFYQHMWQTISSGQIWQGEIHNRRKDGSLFWELATIAPVQNHRSEITNFIAIKEDITTRKELQEQLSLARDQALEASQLKSQLLSRVSHELRTPLGSVLGYAELLRDYAFGPLNDEQRDSAGQIVVSAIYLVALVNDLLDEAQIESKKLTLAMQPFAPQALLQQVQSRMAVLAQSKGLALQVDLIPPLPEKLYGDEKRIQQILINLAGNAIKFTNTGSVKICLYQPDASHWAMQVSDTGPGIPKEAQEYIFEPFRQVNNDVTHENRGTGLGLSIVKQLVKLMGGNIKLDSHPGSGSTFTVSLPITHPEETNS